MIDISLQGLRVYIYTLLKELQPDMTRIRIPNYTESVYKTTQINKEITKLSPVTNWNSSTNRLAASRLPLCIIGRLPCNSHRQTSSSQPSAQTHHRPQTQPHSTFPLSATILIGNSLCKPHTAILSCHPGHVPKNGVNIIF